MFVLCLVVMATQRAGTGADQFFFDLVITNRRQVIVDLARSIVPLGEFLPLMVLALLCTGSLLIRRVDPILAAIAPASMVVAGLLVWALKHLVDRVGPAAQLRRVVEPANSFPSGHAAISAAVLVAIGLVSTVEAGVPSRVRRGVFITCALLAAAVSWSTVALHMHWPTDALGGSALGAAVAATMCVGAQKGWLRAPISALRGSPDGTSPHGEAG